MSRNSGIDLSKKRGIQAYFNIPNLHVKGIISLLSKMKDPHETMIQNMTEHASVVSLVTKEEILRGKDQIISKEEMGLICPHLALIKDQRAYVLCLNEEKKIITGKYIQFYLK